MISMWLVKTKKTCIFISPRLCTITSVMVFTMLGLDPEAQGVVEVAVEAGVDRAFLEQYIKSLKMVR